MIIEVDWEAYHNKLKQLPITDVLSELGVDVSGISGRKKHVLCPVHGEKKPSLFVNEESNIVFCFGSCRRIYDPISLWMGTRRVDFKTASDELGAAFGVSKESPGTYSAKIVIPKKLEKRKIEMPELLDASAAAKYINNATQQDLEYIANLFCIEPWAVEQLGIGIKTSSPRAIVIPVWDESFSKIINLRFRRDDRYEQPDGMMKYWGLQGRNFALPYGLWSLIDNDWVVLIEGEKGVGSLSSGGIPCLSLTTGVNSKSWEDWTYLIDKYRYWIIMFDDDVAGRSATEGMRIKYPGKVVRFPWPVDRLPGINEQEIENVSRQYDDREVCAWGGIDTMDFIRLYGKNAVLERIEKALEMRGARQAVNKNFWFGWRNFCCTSTWAVL